MPILGRVGDWLDERTGWRASLRRGIEHPAVGGPFWGRAIGAAVATCVGVLAVTGIALMTSYAPSPQSAWASVHYLQAVQGGGWIVRGLHSWAAQALFLLAALHVFYVAWTGGYRAPRELSWWLTLLIVALAVGGGITGGLLPWDQRGWWARVVEGNITGLAPLVGTYLQRMMAGGTELGALGLSRAFTAHVIILPIALVGALLARRALARRGALPRSPADAGNADGRARQLAVVAGVATLVILALFVLTAWTHGAPLDAPADPLSDYPARPEWFLLSMFELRKMFHGAAEFWGTSLVPMAAAGYLAVLPFIDRGEDARKGRRCALARAPLVAIFAGAITLSVVAEVHDARDRVYQKERAKADVLATAAGRLAMGGVPPAGALDMVRWDPELRGRDLFDRHCASCHVLG
ncbi:MAG: cytochrome b N-terminal domain-containing protein, partial [Polyangiaceae bacterium]